MNHPPPTALDPELRRLAEQLARGSEDAGDLLQDLWLQIRARPEAGSLAWVRGVLRNLVRNRRRSESARRHRERAVARSEAISDVDAIEGAETRAIVCREVLALREPYRTAILLRYFAHESPDQIADRLQVPRFTVYTRLRRGLEALRSRLEPLRDEVALLPLPFGVEPKAVSHLASTWGGIMLKQVSVVVATIIATVAMTVLVWRPTPEETRNERPVAREGSTAILGDPRTPRREEGPRVSEERIAELERAKEILDSLDPVMVTVHGNLPWREMLVRASRFPEDDRERALSDLLKKAKGNADARRALLDLLEHETDEGVLLAVNDLLFWGALEPLAAEEVELLFTLAETGVPAVRRQAAAAAFYLHHHRNRNDSGFHSRFEALVRGETDPVVKGRNLDFYDSWLGGASPGSLEWLQEMVAVDTDAKVRAGAAVAYARSWERTTPLLELWKDSRSNEEATAWTEGILRKMETGGEPLVGDDVPAALGRMYAEVPRLEIRRRLARACYSELQNGEGILAFLDAAIASEADLEYRDFLRRAREACAAETPDYPAIDALLRGREPGGT